MTKSLNFSDYKNKECYSRLPVCASNLRHLLTGTRFQIRNAFSTFQSPWKAGYLSPLQIFLVGRRPIVNTLGSSSHGPKAFHTKKSVGIFQNLTRKKRIVFVKNLLQIPTQIADPRCWSGSITLLNDALLQIQCKIFVDFCFSLLFQPAKLVPEVLFT